MIDFLLIALVVFLILKAFNKASELTHKKAEEEAQAQPAKPSTEELLTQILEEIKSK